MAIITYRIDTFIKKYERQGLSTIRRKKKEFKDGCWMLARFRALSHLEDQLIHFHGQLRNPQPGATSICMELHVVMDTLGLDLLLYRSYPSLTDHKLVDILTREHALYRACNQLPARRSELFIPNKCIPTEILPCSDVLIPDNFIYY